MKKLTYLISGIVVIALGIWAFSQYQNAKVTSDSDKIRIVASTNVWGNIAQQVGGDNVQVTSILNDPEADPHLFESDAKTAAELGQAQLVIVNGLGYDEFMDKLLEAAPQGERKQLTVSEVLGASEDANPHLWYDLPAVPKVADAMRDELSKIDPDSADEYAKNATEFKKDFEPVLAKLQEIKKQYAGNGVAYTERVAEYVIVDAELQDKTPVAFATAVESGSEPSPADVQAFNEVLKNRTAKVLLYNNQAVNDVTEELQKTAEQAGVGVVGVSETVPPNLTFQAWHLAQLSALLEGLGK